MANPEHLKIIKRGVEVWNKWREDNTDLLLDLRYADLIESDLRNINLANAELSFAQIYLTDLSGANLNHAHLSYANLLEANLTGASLYQADLTSTDFSSANLCSANFTQAHLSYTNLSHAQLDEANFTQAEFLHVVMGNNDLSRIIRLETVRHFSPSTIGLNTLYQSAGKIPEAFLRGCGIPDDFITFIPEHFGIRQAIQFYSCFISYSHKDEDFARRLFSRMREANLRVWYAPEEMKGGQKLHEQIFSAIQLHDKLLLVLSENSLQSEWVATEIRRARKTEREEKRRKLFPIRLVDFKAIEKWEQFDADSGKDLGVEMREYFIPDFSNWKDHDAFEKAFDRLLRDLKAES